MKSSNCIQTPSQYGVDMIRLIWKLMLPVERSTPWGNDSATQQWEMVGLLETGEELPTKQDSVKGRGRKQEHAPVWQPVFVSGSLNGITLQGFLTGLELLCRTVVWQFRLSRSVKCLAKLVARIVSRWFLFCFVCLLVCLLACLSSYMCFNNLFVC